MSGYVKGINRSVSFGQLLNCVGITGIQLMDVVEDRSTWSLLVSNARRAASDRHLFFDGP